MAALPNPHVPAGDYRCRTVKLGAQRGTLGYVAYDWFQCRVADEQGIASLTKLTGTQRPVGLIFPDDLKSQIFLGTLELGDETVPNANGQDRMRAMCSAGRREGTEGVRTGY